MDKAYKNKILPDTSADIDVDIIQRDKNNKRILGLLDSGTNGNFIKRKAFKNVTYESKSVKVIVKGKYHSAEEKQVAIFQTKLPDFCTYREVTVEENAIGRHDLVFGRKFCKEMKLQLNVKTETIIWDDLSIPMKRTKSNINIVNSIDPADASLPTFIQKAAAKVITEMKENDYDKHDYKAMVNKYDHLNDDQKGKLLNLFSKYKDPFSGKLGKRPGPPVEIKLREKVTPFQSQAYTIPQAYMQITKNEISNLASNGVLVQGIESSWKLPSFFRKKKDGGIRFVSDLRKLDGAIEHNAFPLPVIDDVIWKMNGFQFATCLDLTRGYYHFVLSPNSRKRFGIILLLGKICYARMPQGLKISGDIFQKRMTTIFNDVMDLMIYIDNIILYTKKYFDHHLQRLEQVLLRQQ